MAAIVALALTMLAIGSFATMSGSFAHPPGVLFDREAIGRAADAPAAIVLAAGLRGGELDPRSGARTETAVRLFQEARVGQLHFTGGSRGATPTAALMRAYALARGVPPEAISIETLSQTTLQNALFTAEARGPFPGGTILVTDAAHMPRAWASFVWAGYRGLWLVPADRVPGETTMQSVSFVAREALALWYNGVRMATVSVLLLLGADPDRAVRLLDRLPVGWHLPT